ncbi:hypothetical protein C7M46_00020 [Pediococcus pentosaceus]|uniref:phage major tail protein, TP901-1 family n=1 Tax=Pediococcus pentosaceus TaxID=1255 RepID=UPI001363C8CB|nr:phage major tail protein, TP901-1 family [Pediococcus pentosaceus]QHM59377.1 hypothetical protein C7M46_00020 [Pediococcus pentosaceus]
MTASTVQKFQGNDVVAYARLLDNAKTEAASLIPGQTSFEFDPQRDSDSTDTKDGSFSTNSSLETDVEVDFINNSSKIADQMITSIMKGKVMEIWAVNRKRRNKDGKYYAWYMRGTVSEDDNSNDAGDISERDVSFSISGEPQRGWLALSDDQQAEIDYIFRGLDAVTEGEDGAEVNGGTPWNDETDAGVDIPDTNPSK